MNECKAWLLLWPEPSPIPPGHCHQSPKGTGLIFLSSHLHCCPLIWALSGPKSRTAIPAPLPSPSLPFPSVPPEDNLQAQGHTNPQPRLSAPAAPAQREEQKLLKDSSNRQWGSGEARQSKNTENPFLSPGEGVARGESQGLGNRVRGSQAYWLRS